ncbi:hypothetical protein HKCCE3408_18090, partial [Rhodobacterales bacterium HKCCE3408]|nr:hypothetical protein [Rhodobacterales bacterium HKCCE3408]
RAEPAPAPEDDLPPGLPPGIAARLRRNRGLDDDVPADDGAPAAAAYTPLDEAFDDLTPNRRSTRPVIGPVPEDDPLMTSGLLARRTDSAARPSLRTALVLTLVFALLLALVAVWSALFLPDSRIAQLFGRVAPVIDTVEAPQPVPDIADEEAADEAIAALPPVELEDPAPEAAETADPAPEAPVETAAVPAPEVPEEELPGIDDDLPEPDIADVVPPRPLPTPEQVAAEYEATGIWQLPPDAPATPGNEFLVPEVHDDITLAALDPATGERDAVALWEPNLPGRSAVRPPPVAPEFGATLPPEPIEIVPATPDGVVTPQGAFVVAGRPPVDAVQRPGPDPEPAETADAEADPDAAQNAVADAVASALADIPQDDEADEAAVPDVTNEALREFLPTQRPGDLSETRERQILGGLTLDELRDIRPRSRPESLQEVALAAQAAQAAVANAPEGSDLAVAVSSLPEERPASIEEQAARGPAAGASLASVGPTEAPETVQPDIPSSANVTRSATMENVINLREVNLIGVSGTPSDRRALVRLPSGRFVTVGVGDRIDGGQVAAIGPSTLQYVKNGRNITLEVPNG